MTFDLYDSIISGMAEGDILQDAEVQKAALQVIINCVCGPCSKVSPLCNGGQIALRLDHSIIGEGGQSVLWVMCSMGNNTNNIISKSHI